MSLENYDSTHRDDDVQRVPGESYKIVADLLTRQESVLADLEHLNDRIEAAIKEMLPPAASESEPNTPRVESEESSDRKAKAA